MAILFVLVVAVVVVIGIVIVAMRSTKQANEAEVCVDCAPESGSLLVGRDSPDTAPKPLDDSQVSVRVLSVVFSYLLVLLVTVLSRRLGGGVSDRVSHRHHKMYVT